MQRRLTEQPMLQTLVRSLQWRTYSDVLVEADYLQEKCSISPLTTVDGFPELLEISFFIQRIRPRY